MANFDETGAGAYSWDGGGVYVIVETDFVEGGLDGISNRQGRELALRTRNLHERQEQAQIDTITKVEAAVRVSKEYTDAREVAIQTAVDTKDATTLRTAKDYADTIVAALVDNSPEALNTLQELAAALGNDPNFATTMLQQIGEKLPSASYTAADVLLKMKSVDGQGSGLEADVVTDQKTGSALKMWRGTEAEYNAVATKDPNTLYIVQ